MCPLRGVGQGMYQHRNVGRNSLSHVFDSTNFSSLKTVTMTCEFCGSEDCGISGTDKNIPYIVVDLPSLEKADYFQVVGTVKRFGPHLRSRIIADYISIKRIPA
jgi:hypothetical protein